ncbi:MAG: AAA family ATPase, partial [Lachnospiraceae bacterium]|nr:AAA family ATPase [Lachnospiraceae bacterium]
MEIKRDIYLQKLIDRMHNGMIKTVTGIRRSGKSYLLFRVFRDYLLNNGVDHAHIISIELDRRENKKYRNPDVILNYITTQIVDNNDYYILLDEVQMLEEFEEVLNSLLHISNVDVYVTGSNSKFLSKDIITEFRGRGDEIHVYPVSFREFMEVY